MQDFLDITKALSDETRVRALMALAGGAGSGSGGERGGELCLCQIIDLLGLAPSTVSRHMSLLHQAGLVARRKEGRWHYYRLAQDSPSPRVREALAWTLTSLAKAPTIVQDRRALRSVLKKELVDVSVCYRD